MHKIFSVALLLLTIISCNDSNDFDSTTIGDDFIKSETTIAIIDTFTVRLSTFIDDSIVTSNTSVGLVGNYTDEDLGIVRAKSFYQLGISTGTYSMDIRDKFDSLTITMRYSGVSFGDTTKLQKINVYRLTQELKARSDGSLYNISSVPHEAEPIGSITIKPQPKNDKNLIIRLNDAWGQELFDSIQNKSGTILTEEKFLQYLPGLAIGSETDDGSVLTFSLADSLFYMTVHASRFEYDLIETDFVFPMINANLQFNQIKSDRAGTNSALIADSNHSKVYSEQTANRSFSQGGIGMYTRIEFPGVGGVLKMDQKRFLMKAELILKPVFRSYEEVPLPDNIYLYESNRTNEVVAPLLNSDNEPLTPKFVLDDIYYEDTYYMFDITTFITSELSDGHFDVEHALLVNILKSKMGSSLERIILSDSSKSKYKPVLKLYYVFYN
ncbi:MAG: DUF4270 family protein [Prolixibacteraceae bacterium]|jgi:hypothetical protein|nr:DUF4270 family protein [Prolixibacteraceae bacterium]